MRTISSTEAKAKLNALLSEIEKSGEPITITTHGRPVAVLSPAQPRPRVLGRLAGRLTVPPEFDAPLTAAELAEWEGA